MSASAITSRLSARSRPHDATARGGVFVAELYAYRPGRNAQQAVVEVEELLFRGHPDVVDADLADYFGSIPHADLLKSVARRIVDRRVLHLVRMWLDCPVEETELLSLTNGRMFPLSVQDGKSGVNGPVDIVGVR